MILRDYQLEARHAVNRHVAEKHTNPLVVIPTAGGKTVVFASLIYDWFNHPQWPAPRVGILAHVKELLSQAERKLLQVWPAAPVGIYSAGLRRRESAPITIAAIQSIYRRAFDLFPFDILIIDEAHLIPTTGEGMYRRFINDCKKMNPNLIVIGFTATPFRLSGGFITGPGKILHEVCYEADIARLIKAGYLSPLRSKGTSSAIDTVGVGTANGDFIVSDLEARANTDDMVRGAVREIVSRGADRGSWLIFCCSVTHAENVSRELASYRITAPVVTGDTNPGERDQIITALDAGTVRAVCNVNCLTTGLDVTRIDLIAMLRPTKSTSLFVQMAGRGFRLHPGKTDCLVLDFGGNVRRHGPIDAIRMRESSVCEGKPSAPAPTKECPECQEIIHAAAVECPACHHQFPPREGQHDAHADSASILRSSESFRVHVARVIVDVHSKPGKPDSLRVTYYGPTPIERYREYICLEHDGYAKTKAHQWWVRRFGQPVPATVADAMGSLFLAHRLTDLTESIMVRQVTKYPEITSITLRTDKPHAIFA
ncbi:MAG TPA: DEAD/DEAH box helicase family protein [Tepidisphaeraceae bacterium]|jgi:DNA repair protein RadD|nr:DEAD/DEAH box helicase family protein [Tepidisphaeraceae bacterium]